ncbi:MAG: hypothetical protein HWN65_15005 [Candidatus Helarchaeota archaeon]|nr:hypothetical protein [Candidatus Helarchaeota archaeon]
MKTSKLSVILILMLMLWLFPFLNNTPYRTVFKNNNELHSNAIIWTDASGDVQDITAMPATYDPVDVTSIDENGSMSMINASFVATPAFGGTPGWMYSYMLDFDKDFDNTTDYSVVFGLTVGVSLTCSIIRQSDMFEWNGTAFVNNLENDTNYAYVSGNSMIFNFSSCPILIGNNWYNVWAYYVDPTFTTAYFDFAIGDLMNMDDYFPGGTTGQDTFPPAVQSARTVPSVGLNGTVFTIKANVTDPSNVSTVIATIQHPDETFIANVTLFDDGLHGDGGVNDTMFANTWNSTGQVNGIYYIDIWANDTVGNAGEVDNMRYFIIGAVNETGLFDGLYMTWTGYYNVGLSTPWNGSENYQFVEGNAYLNNHVDSLFGGGTWYTDNGTRILNTANPFWGDDVHDHIFIPTTIVINDILEINMNGLWGTDENFVVNDIKYISALGTSLECWELVEQFGPSILYYETSTGLLINGTFDSGGGWYYTIIINSSNAQFGAKPVFTVSEPRNTTYYYSNVPVLISNSTPLVSAWYRNSTNGVTWSNNQTLTSNGTHYFDFSTNWEDGTNVIQIFGNNSFGFTMMQEIWFTVDTYGPWIELDSPEAFPYYLYRTMPIIVSNNTAVDYCAFRYDRNSMGWTSNMTLNWNGTHFVNETISWSDGYYTLQVMANDSTSEMAMREIMFRVAASLPLNITHNQLSSAYPKVILSAPDDVHLFWSTEVTPGQAELLYDHNLIGHFGNQMNLSKFPGGSDVLADVATDPGGNVHLVWIQEDITKMQFLIPKYSNNTGGQFNPDIEVSTTSWFNMFPTIAVDSQNIVHLAWLGLDIATFHWNIYYTNNTGGSFNLPQNITSSTYNETLFLSMGVDSSDVIHLAYVSDIYGNLEIMYRSITNGVVSPPTNISRRPGFDITPSLTVNSTGTVHIAWRGEGSAPSESEIFYANNSVGIFSPPLNVSRDSSSSDVSPCIKLDETPDPDIVFISWSYNTTFVFPGSQMQIVMVNNTLGSFGEKTEITPLHQFVNASHFTIDPITQKIHVVWMQTDDYLVEPSNIFYTYLNYSYAAELELLSPQNQTYSYQDIPIITQNSTFVEYMWFRYDNGTGWSSNQTLSYNGSHFVNQSSLIWTDGFYHIQVFGNETSGLEGVMDEWFTVDSQAPTGIQWLSTTANYIQTGTVIWINGTASDPAPSSGLSISNIYISGSNTSATWSTNIRPFLPFWGFYNLSPIQENAPNEFYQVNVTIRDNAGNEFILIGNIAVDATPPSGSQYPNTTIPQNAAGGLVWINGSAVDYGTGLKSVSIMGDNVTGGTTWSVNMGSNSSWSFSNTSMIQDTPANSVYEVLVNLTDLANNSRIILTYIIVDTISPTGNQYLTTTIPQKGDWNNNIWFNGTAFDSGTGVKSINIIGDNVTGGTTWSINIGSLSDWAFSNTSTILDTPLGNIYEVLVNITDNADNSFILPCYIFVDTTSPNGTQSALTYYTTIQTIDVNGRIWINGTASDLGSGLQSVSFQSSNVTGGSNWINIGTTSNWAFYNITPIPEPLPGEKYLIEINITDVANNSFLLECYISVDLTGPSLTQNQSTRDPQSGVGVWVNGTAADVWVNIQNVAIIDSNLTSPASWTTNSGTNESWSFTNNSAVIDGCWEIIIQAVDSLGNIRNFSAIIIVDNTAPTQATLSYTVTGSNVTLTWLPATDLTDVTYIIYQNGFNIANTTSLYYQVTDLPDGQYVFMIKAMDEIGHIGEDSNVITVQIGDGDGEPPDPFLTIIIIAIGAAIGVLAGIFTYRRGRGGMPPLVTPKKPSWVTKAFGYTPEFEQKLLRLSKVPQKPEKIKDPQLAQFLKQAFTALPSSIIAQIDNLPYTESEKIEILQALLILPPVERQQLLAELSEEPKEAAS